MLIPLGVLWVPHSWQIPLISAQNQPRDWERETVAWEAMKGQQQQAKLSQGILWFMDTLESLDDRARQDRIPYSSPANYWCCDLGHSPNFSKCHFFLFKNMDLFFREVLDSQQNWEGGTEISHLSPAPQTCMASPMISIPYKIATLLKWMNLHWYIKTLKGPFL